MAESTAVSTSLTGMEYSTPFSTKNRGSTSAKPTPNTISRTMESIVEATALPIAWRKMKAALLMPLVFSQKPDLGFSKEHTLEVNREEVEHYKSMLEGSKTRYQFDSVQEQEDGSIIVRVRKQYNYKAEVDEYFN